MKKALIAIAILFSFNCNAQNATIDKSGNYVAIQKKAASEDKATGKTFTDAKGNKYPVMVSKNGKLFYVRTSKTGKEYKVYIKTEG